LALYPNRIQGILRPPGCKSWTTLSKHWPIPDETIRSAVAGEEAGVWGLRWDKQTKFAVLDIDQGSKYHSLLELQKLQAKLAAVELKAMTYQSSESGGWHLYLFWQDWADCKELQETLKAWLYSHGYEIRNGTLEIFPSGNGLRLPLQPSFAWLDANAELITERKELAADAAISRFLCDLESNANNWEKSKSLIKAQLEAVDRAGAGSAQAQQERLDTEGFNGLFKYRLIPEKYQDGRQYWQTGLTDSGQRHDAILAVEHYLWHGDEIADIPAMPGHANDGLRYELIRAWIETKHKGYCNHINRGKWGKVEAQIRRAVKWRRPTGAIQVQTPYAETERALERLIELYKLTGRVWTMDDLKKGNEGRQIKAQEKIREALQLLSERGEHAGIRKLMRMTGCCNKVIKRYLHIQAISPAVALPSVGGELNSFLDLDLLRGGGLRVLPSEEESFFNRPGDADSGDLSSGGNCWSGELAPIDITPPLLLPGDEPTIELPVSRPNPAGSYGSLDTGALVRRFSGRAADVAGGLEPEPLDRRLCLPGVHSLQFRLSGILIVSQEPDLAAWSVCTQWLIKGLRTLENKGARAPPL
jgi:hypothetical protein